jgi:tetratricopeptide (TPR) repeat protein
MEADQFKEAKAVYARALNSHPDLWPAANDLAFLKCEYPDSPEDLDSALELAKKAHEMQPNQPAVIDTLGWVYYKLGDTERSLALLEESTGKAPDSPIFNYHLGMALIRSGEKEKAVERLKRALNSGQAFIGKEDAIKTVQQLS